MLSRVVLETLGFTHTHTHTHTHTRTHTHAHTHTHTYIHTHALFVTLEATHTCVEIAPDSKLKIEKCCDQEVKVLRCIQAADSSPLLVLAAVDAANLALSLLHINVLSCINKTTS